MTKKMITFWLIFALAFPSFTFALTLSAYAEEPGFTERAVKLITDGEETGEISLFFCDATPNLAYMGMNQAAALLGRPGFTVRASGDGRYELESWNGARLVCEAEEGRILVADWNAFFALPMPLEGRALGFKDTSVPFCRITDITYAGDAAPVTIDFAAYGIRLYCNERDLYLPVSTLSNLMTDIATNFLLYNGEALYAQRASLDGNPIEGFFASDMMQALIHGEDRPGISSGRAMRISASATTVSSAIQKRRLLKKCLRKRAWIRRWRVLGRTDRQSKRACSPRPLQSMPKPWQRCSLGI